MAGSIIGTSQTENKVGFAPAMPMRTTLVPSQTRVQRVNQKNFTPAPNARRQVAMMAERKYTKTVKLPGFIGMSPLDPDLPKAIEEW